VLLVRGPNAQTLLIARADSSSGPSHELHCVVNGPDLTPAGISVWNAEFVRKCHLATGRAAQPVCIQVSQIKLNLLRSVRPDGVLRSCTRRTQQQRRVQSNVQEAHVSPAQHNIMREPKFYGTHVTRAVIDRKNAGILYSRRYESGFWRDSDKYPEFICCAQL
jgi:hypothetical protein